MATAGLYRYLQTPTPAVLHISIVPGGYVPTNPGPIVVGELTTEAGVALTTEAGTTLTTE